MPEHNNTEENPLMASKEATKLGFIWNGNRPGSDLKILCSKSYHVVMGMRSTGKC